MLMLRAARFRNAATLFALRLDAANYYSLLGPLEEFTEWAKMAQTAGCPPWRGTSKFCVAITKIR